MPERLTLLYVSDLAASVQPDAIFKIATQSRRNNAQHDITGLLIFDGLHFAQLLEGPAQAVESLKARLDADSRHEQFEVLFYGAHTPPRRLHKWRLGYLLFNLHEFGIPGLRGKRSTDAINSFNFMLPALDDAVGEQLPTRLKRRPVTA